MDTKENEKDTEFEPRDDEIFGSYEHEGKTHHFCIEETALAKLLVDGILFVGDFNSGPFFSNESNEKTTCCVWVNCGDTFMYACADAEPVTMKELPELYRMHKENDWGATKWCCKKRNLQPISPIIKRMRDENVWDEMMESLDKNSD